MSALTTHPPVFEPLEHRLLFAAFCPPLANLARAAGGLGELPLAYDWIELDHRGDAAVSGVLSAGGEQVYCLVTPAGGRARIALDRSGGLDALLEVYDRRGRLRASDAWSSELPGPSAEGAGLVVPLKRGAPYFVKVSARGDSSGGFVLSVDAARPRCARIRLGRKRRTILRRGRIRRPGKAQYFRFSYYGAGQVDSPEVRLASAAGGLEPEVSVWQEDVVSASAGEAAGPEVGVSGLAADCYVRVSGADGTTGKYALTIEPYGCIYVAPDGKDGNSGTLTSPFASLSRARAAAREMIASGLKEEVKIILRGGTYELDEPISLGPEDSGYETYRITYMAYPGEQPVLSGGRRLSLRWKRADDGVYVADVGDLRFRQLYVNGQRATRASSGAYLITNYEKARVDGQEQPGPNDAPAITGRVLVRLDRLPQLDSLEELVGCEMYLKRKFASHVLTITAVERDPDPADASPRTHVALRFREEQAKVLKVFNIRAVQDYYTLQGLPFLDSPGEWWLEGSRLYYVPRAGEVMTSTEVVVPVLETILRLDGASHVSFEGIGFAHAGWNRPTEKGFLGQPAGFFETGTEGYWQASYHPPAAVSLSGVRDVTFTNCTFEHLGGVGLAIGAGSREVTVRKCLVRDVSGNGINIDDYSAGPWRFCQATRVRSVRITRCIISHFGREFFGSVGIWVGPAQFVTLDHNEVANGPYSGISMGHYSGDGVQGQIVVVANHIHHVMGELSDGGAIYATGGSLRGSRVEANYIHDVLVSETSKWPSSAHAAVYLEPITSGITVQRNVVLATTHARANTQALWVWGSNVVKDNYFTTAGHGDIIANVGPAGG